MLFGVSGKGVCSLLKKFTTAVLWSAHITFFIPVTALLHFTMRYRQTNFLQASLLHGAFGNSSNEAQPAGCFSQKILQEINGSKNYSFKLILYLK